jgi:SAM-dependent methyltransferase
MSTRLESEQERYPLGYGGDEFRRLERQGALFRPLTEDLLRRAGIGPGMRVLDVGCGVGDVSLVAAALVGPSGSVLGIDRSADAVDTAARRARAADRGWVHFAATELGGFADDRPFDAVVGRLVLMYQPDPVEALRRLARHAAPGGLLVFQEMAMPLARAVPDAPLFRRCGDWIMRTFERAGFECDMGGKLFTSFRAAGLPAPEMIVAGAIGGGPASPLYDYMAGLLTSLLPVAERVGVTNAAEVDVATLAARLRREAVEREASIMLPPFVGAWARLPST